MQCPATGQEDIIPGLAFINPLNQLIVAKRRDNLHDIIGRTGVAYTVFNREGQKVFLGVLTKRFRQFDVRIFNNYGNEVINVKRPFHFCAKEVLVWAPPGHFLGSVRGRPGCSNTYIARDENGKKVWKIRSVNLCKDVYNVYVISYGESPIAVLKNQIPEVDEKNIGVSFPKEINVKEKAVLLGACFLVWPSRG